MIELALRRFCESKHRGKIVIAGTFIVGLLLVLPLVDAIRAGREEKETLLTELESARLVASDIAAFERRVDEKLAQLKSFDARTVDDASLPNLRGQLMDFAKNTGCSIRRLNVGGVSSRAWQPGQSLFGTGTDKKPNDANPGFVLEWRPLNLSLGGSTAGLQSMVEKIAASKMFLNIKGLEMYPSSPKRDSRTMDMEIWYFTLVRKS
jgi:hypothetical protein